jgi:hypothetical protein
MHLVMGNVAVLAVTAIFYAWRAYAQCRKQRQLRERVAYMLWVMANRADAAGSVMAAD